MESDKPLEETLKHLLETLEDWERAPTTIPGVRIIKIPAKNDLPARLGVEINPVDEHGKVIKRSGAIVLTNEELFEHYRRLINNEKTYELIHEIEKIRNQLHSKKEPIKL